MSEKKIIDLGQYRKKKIQEVDESKPLNSEDRSLDEKLQEFIHRPFDEPGTKNELLTIFEEDLDKKELDKKEMDDKEE